MTDYKIAFNHILESFEEDRVEEFAVALNDFRKQLMDKVLPSNVRRNADVFNGAQSIEFMRHLVDEVHGYFSSFEQGKTFAVLDVGPDSGEGSHLLAKLYRSKILGYSANVYTLDICDYFHLYHRLFLPYIHPKIGTIEDEQKVYDVVVASHVIEHVSDPKSFCERLQQMSRGIVIICAPYEEREPLIDDHLHTLDAEFVSGLSPVSYRLIESSAWGQFVEPRYKMFVAVLEGKAE